MVCVQRAHTGSGQPRGFAFVNYTNVNDATRAVEKGNGTTVGGRPVAVDFALSNEKYKEQQQLQLQQQKQNEEEEEDKSSEESSDESEESEGSGSGSESGSESGSGSDSGSDSEEESGSDSDSDSDEDDEDESDSESEEEVKKRPPKKSDVDEGKTLFLRNLSYQTTEETIKERFEDYGRVLFAKLVRDRETDESRGTAFVKFYSSDDAANCLKAAYASKEAAKNDPRVKKIRKRAGFKSRHEQESDIIVDGRRIIVAMAVTKKEASSLQQKAKWENTGKKKKVKDKRNLHLAEIGVIKPDSPEAAKMSSMEVQKRLRAWQEKKMKLANPNFHVSKTRLSVRGLPKSLTEAELKTIFRTAATTADDKTKYGPAIKQVKIVMDKTNLDANGNPQSRGFGFIEFKRHFHALTALHNTNNRPGIIPRARDRRLIVEFSVENSKMLQRRKLLRDRQLDAQGGKKRKRDEGEEISAPKPKKPRTSKSTVTLPPQFSKKKPSPSPTDKSSANSDSNRGNSPSKRKARANSKGTNNNSGKGQQQQQQRAKPSPQAKPNKKNTRDRRNERIQKKAAFSRFGDEGQRNQHRGGRRGKKRQREEEDHFESLVKSYKMGLGSKKMKKWDA